MEAVEVVAVVAEEVALLKQQQMARLPSEYPTHFPKTLRSFGSAFFIGIRFALVNP
jgi:hypothetical protein